MDENQSEEVSFYDIWGEDNMPYPYSKYRDGAATQAHIRDFLTTWEINHGAQRLSATTEDLKLLSLFYNWMARKQIGLLKMTSERSIHSNS